MRKKIKFITKLRSKKNILIIDDEECICKILKKFLSLEGYNSKYLLSGIYVENALKKKAYDVVFMDLIMSGITADELIEKIRGIAPKSKLIIITGGNMTEEIFKTKYKNKGVSGYILKPFKSDKILKYLA